MEKKILGAILITLATVATGVIMAFWCLQAGVNPLMVVIAAIILTTAALKTKTPSLSAFGTFVTAITAIVTLATTMIMVIAIAMVVVIAILVAAVMVVTAVEIIANEFLSKNIPDTVTEDFI